jgi:hypothetical protein
LNFNSHLHIIATDGCFGGQDNFMVGTSPNSSDLEELFRAEVFKMLKKERKIKDSLIENMMSWHNSGFNVYFHGPPTDMRNMRNDAIMIPEFLDFADDVFLPNTYEDDYSQMTYEDDYSQLTSYEEK